MQEPGMDGMSMAAPMIHIYQIDGTSQYLVKAGTAEYSFVRAEDAQRFANELSPVKKTFEVKNIKAGQQWSLQTAMPPFEADGEKKSYSPKAVMAKISQFLEIL